MKGAILLLLAGRVVYGQPSDRDSVSALAKMLLRDAAELPIDVAVKTVVTDAKGKVKRNAQGSVRLLFRGYNQQSGTWSFRSDAGLFNLRILHDSIAGTFALFDAFTTLAPKEPRDDYEFQPGRIRAPFKDCHEFEMMKVYLFPKKRCYAAEFRLGAEGSIESFSLDIGALPARAAINYLGEVEVQKIHAEGELQKAYLPTDTKPFLVPKQVRTLIVTDKGRIELTNDYALRPGRPKK